MLARSAKKAGQLSGAKVVVGDALDEASVRRALRDRDVVISALGTPASPLREVTLLSSATRVLVNAMKAENIRRLVAITGIGAGDGAGHGSFLFDRVIFPLLLRRVYADKNRQEDIVRASGLDWVLVRPSFSTTSPAAERSGHSRIFRASMAARSLGMTSRASFYGGLWPLGVRGLH
ncbi:putative NADH-flavin reductase [Mesorhizobium robiniae]|uniref:NADH-flavin reductase n=1 Tax=Mesorhizobium robiniae TaxID=559315 RepID=A0ABV2GNU2_9HYPH